MMNIAICDDEKQFIEEEKRLILKYFKEKNYDCCVDTFLSGEELLALVQEIHKYTIIFLDVNMKELDGLETARKIRKLSRNIFLVFVTAFVKYSPEGYKVEATRFLIKGEGNLEFAINECLDTIYKKMPLAEWKHTFQFREEILELGASDIMYISSYLRQIKFVLVDDLQGSYTMNKKLDLIDSLLSGKGFLRLHKSFLVNQQYIKNISRYEAELCNGERIPISKARYMDIRNQYLAFRGGL